MSELRLGDVIDDYCIKCRRLTNHSIVSMVEGDVAKVRCRSCYHDHNYLHEQIPPSKKDLKKAELAAQAAEAGEGGETAPPVEPESDVEQETVESSAGSAESEPAKKRPRAKKS